jgi:hypothetical protein
MTSKFTPIAKVRKQQRDIVETCLAKARFEKREIEQEIIVTCIDIDKIQIPTSGSISLMNMTREKLAIIRQAKDILQERLFTKESEIEQLLQKYKRADREYEKIKYLEGQDFQSWIEKAKKDEQLEMDEISNTLFVNKEQK